MKAVLDAEFAAFESTNALSSDGRVAIVGGHSRGFLSAATFKLEYPSAYARVLVVGFDGAVCMPYTDLISQGATTFVLAPSLGLAGGGILRSIWGAARENVLTGGYGESPFGVDLGEVETSTYLSCITQSGHWRRAATMAGMWSEASYDGPSFTQCGGLIIGREYFSVRPRDICTTHNGVYACAGHMTLVTVLPFARVASRRVRCFLQAKIDPAAMDDATCQDVYERYADRPPAAPSPPMLPPGSGNSTPPLWPPWPPARPPSPRSPPVVVRPHGIPHSLIAIMVLMCVVPGMGMLAHVGGYLWRRCAEGNDEFDLMAGDSNLNLADRFSPSAQKKVTTDPERKSQAWRESINDLEEASRAAAEERMSMASGEQGEATEDAV